METIENKYKKFFKYLTVDDIISISKDVLLSESTVRKYLNEEYPDTELGKNKFHNIIEKSIEILKCKSAEILEMIENA